MLKQVQKGFTLIELMIVVAIVGILAAIAIPAYQNYTIRAQVTEGLSLVAAWQTAVAEYYSQNGTWPSASAVVGNVATGTMQMAGATTGKYVSNVGVIAGGVVQATFSNAAGFQANAKINGGKLGFTPYTSLNFDVIWVCGTAPAPTTGATIATGATAGGGTINLAAQYLPASCHP